MVTSSAFRFIPSRIVDTDIVVEHVRKYTESGRDLGEQTVVYQILIHTNATRPTTPENRLKNLPEAWQRRTSTYNRSSATPEPP